MMFFNYRHLVLIVACTAIGYHSYAQGVISMPIMAGNNAPNQEICERASIQLRFEHANFMFDNVFTVQLAANGDFANGPIINLIGQRVVAGNSTNQNITVTIPSPNTILPNTSYQVRIKGSSPLTYSPPNQFPFTIAKIGLLADSAFFPEGYWRGSFYSWTPSVQTIITDANTQDIFNRNNYLGYVTKESLSFDLNWGFDLTAAPGNLFDTNKVCGNQASFYSIRMRRKVNFEAGFYIFGGGGDDGFRLSTDGGATWLINLWRDQEFTGRLNNNGCGVYLDAGPKNLVVDYYERAEHSRFQVIIRRTGDPAVNPVIITNPAEGSSVCLLATPFQMLANSSGAETWSGPGVSPSGMFNPQLAGLGSKTITYETGMAGFGANCVKSASVTIRVVEGVTSDFSGLDTAYCEGSANVTLLPQLQGGTFSGTSVAGNELQISRLKPGSYRVGYSLDSSSGCSGDTLWKNFTISAAPDARFTDLPDSVFTTSPPIQLVPNQPGGIFSGQGVVSFNAQWIPSILPPGIYQIQYELVSTGCSGKVQQTVKVVEYRKPVYRIPNVVTPDSDGNNDTFFIKGMPDGLGVTIFDRWGKEVYAGTTSNELVWKSSEENGTFFYVIVDDLHGEKYSGWLQIIK